MAPWSVSELQVFRLEFHFSPTYSTPTQIQDHLLAAMQRCFGTSYRTYARPIVNAQLSQERYRGNIPGTSVKPISHYTSTTLHAIAFNRFQNLASRNHYHDNLDNTIALAFPYFHGHIEWRGGRAHTNPQRLEGFDIVESADYVGFFTTHLASTAWPGYLQDECMNLFNQLAHSHGRNIRRYSNLAITNRLIHMVRDTDLPLIVTPQAVEYCIWSHIRMLPADGQLQRAIQYCWGRHEIEH